MLAVRARGWSSGGSERAMSLNILNHSGLERLGYWELCCSANIFLIYLCAGKEIHGTRRTHY